MKRGLKLIGALVSILTLCTLLIACGDATATPAATTAAATTAAATTAAGAATTAAAAATTAAPASGKPPVEIRIGHGFATEEPLWLLIADPTLAPNYGKSYTVKNTAFRANADRFTAFQAGQLDGGTVAAFTAIFAKAEGVPIKLVATLAQENPNEGFVTQFLALSDSGITKPADLKGKTIGIVDYKSSTDLWARSGVISAGLNPERDVKFVVVPFPNMGEALRSKKIDVGTFVQPFYASEKEKGGVTEVFTSKTGIPFTEELITIFFAEDFLKKNPEAVKAFLSDLKKTTEYYLANTAKARQTLIDKKFVQTAPALYLGLKDWSRRPNITIDLDSMKKLQDRAVELKLLENPKPITDLVDNTFIG